MSLSRARGESGMTLVELLIGAALGTIVVLAAFTILDHAVMAEREVADREDALQRGRIALERVTRPLRSQVCTAGQTASIVSGSDDSVTFYTDLSDGSRVPEKRTIAFDPAARTLTEHVYAGTGTAPNVVYPASPTRTERIVGDVTAVPGVPVFRYFAFDDGGSPGANQQLTTPLSAADTPRTTRIAISFVARPTRATSDHRATTLHDDVYVRSADPTNPTGAVSCL